MASTSTVAITAITESKEKFEKAKQKTKLCDLPVKYHGAFSYPPFSCFDINAGINELHPTEKCPPILGVLHFQNIPGIDLSALVETMINCPDFEIHHTMPAGYFKERTAFWVAASQKRDDILQILIRKFPVQFKAEFESLEKFCAETGLCVSTETVGLMRAAGCNIDESCLRQYKDLEYCQPFKAIIDPALPCPQYRRYIYNGKFWYSAESDASQSGQATTATVSTSEQSSSPVVQTATGRDTVASSSMESKTERDVPVSKPLPNWEDISDAEFSRRCNDFNRSVLNYALFNLTSIKK
jgi:hypothetical protein